MTGKFLVLWPVYFYLAVTFGDKTWQHGQHFYMRVRSLFSYSQIQSLQKLRKTAKAGLRSITEKYGPEIFPNFAEMRQKKVKDYTKSESLDSLIQENFNLMDDLGI